jgi:hypothetical protein
VDLISLITMTAATVMPPMLKTTVWGYGGMVQTSSRLENPLAATDDEAV